MDGALTTISQYWSICQNLQICSSYHQTSDIRCPLVGNKHFWSLRCSWSIACRRCSNYIFILDLTHGFSGLGKDDCKTGREKSKFLDLELWRHVIIAVLWHCSWLPTRSESHPVRAAGNWHCCCEVLPQRSGLRPQSGGLEHGKDLEREQMFTCRKVSNIRCTKSQNSSVSHLGLQLSLSNRLKPSVQWRMKM